MISSRSKLIIIGSAIMLAALSPVIAYFVNAPQDMANRILWFLVTIPFLLSFGGAPFLWKETEWWYRLQLKRRGPEFNSAILSGLKTFGQAMLGGAFTILFGESLSAWSWPWLGVLWWVLVWLGALLWALLWLGVLIWGWRPAPRAG